MKSSLGKTSDNISIDSRGGGSFPPPDPSETLIELSESLPVGFICSSGLSVLPSGIFVATTQCLKAFVPHPIAASCVSGLVDKRCQTELDLGCHVLQRLLLILLLGCGGVWIPETIKV